MKKYLLVGLILFLHGCSTYQPIPKNYTGPRATITDSGFSEDGTKAQIFALTEINGKLVKNSFGASAGASYGQGFALTTVYVSREVQAKPMKVELTASHTTAAPIHALFSQANGTFFSVKGVTTFSPKPNRNYVVKGELKKDGSTVWIEDKKTGKRVTKIIKEEK